MDRLSKKAYKQKKEYDYNFHKKRLDEGFEDEFYKFYDSYTCKEKKIQSSIY